MADTLQPILVVDDYPDGRQLLAEYLQFRGFHVVTAKSGRDAVQTALRIQPVAILMDLRMPDMDGWEATRHLRKLEETRDVMIVAVTAAALNDEVRSALDAGCDAVVAKPYDLLAFGDALATALADGVEAFAAIGATVQPASRSRRASAPRGSRAKAARAAQA
ncbi:MAG TPA: response regulator [Vicinamibacterales bacterium]|nr:response regulator [Vicinamibacterales bacterium]